jgi:transposase-like protein
VHGAPDPRPGAGRPVQRPQGGHRRPYKNIYLAPSADLAAEALDGFAAVRDQKYPMIAKSWRNRRNEVILFFKFPPEIRKAVYTANAIESVNFTIQKIIKHHQSFPNDEVAMKLMFMSLKNIAGKWTMPVRDWGLPSINLQSFTGKTESPYDFPVTQNLLQAQIRCQAPLHSRHIR